MMKRSLITLTVLLALAGACQQKQTASVASSEPKAAATTDAMKQTLTPEQLGELGAKIEKSPDQAATLLSEHGLNEKTFEQQIRRVTEDPEASKRYAAAYEKAKA
jgi:nucleotide-binding universal stress UspA family protein